MTIKILARIFPLMLTLYLSDAGALDITGKSAEAYLRYEYNRTFRSIGELQAIGGLQLDSVYTGRAGFSYGRIGGGSDVKAFAGGGVTPFARARQLGFSLNYIYNGMPAFETRASAVIPVVSYNANRFGVSVGPVFRFTSFFGEPAIFEYVVMFSLHWNIINKENLRAGLCAGNLNELHVGSKGVHSPKLFADIGAGDNWRVINVIEYLQSGGDGLAAVFYGLAWRGGVKYSW